MYVVRVPNRGSRPAVLLRESFREDGKVKNRTLANLSRWPEQKVEALSAVLGGKAPRVFLDGAFEISRSLPHGGVAATLGTLRHLGLEEILDPVGSRMRDLVVAMICAQVIDPASKLAIARGLRLETASTSLGEVLGLSGCDADDLYDAMDWLGQRQAKIEDALARRHLVDGTLVLYDVSSAAFEGRTCPLGALGHPKDGVRGRLQIVYGLLTSADGTPIAIEVFKGNTGDPTTVASQVRKVKERFAIAQVCLVGDRGMLTKARLRADVLPAELDYITALRAPEIKGLVEGGAIQLSLFDETDLFEIVHPDYPNERLVCCKNPLLAEERSRKRESLLAATETELAKIADAIARERRPPRGAERIGLRLGRVVNRYKMAKHFDIAIGDDSFNLREKERADRRRSGARWDLRAAHEPVGRGTVDRRGRLLLQVPRRSRAGVSRVQHRPRYPSHPPPDRRARPRACLFADVLLLRHLPHGAGARADAVPRRRQRGGRGIPHEPGRPGAAFSLRAFEGDDEEDRRPSPGPQLPEPARRPRHHLRQPDRTDRRRPRGLHARHHANTDTAPRLRAPRRLPPSRLRVVMTSRAKDPNCQVIGVRATTAGGTSA